MNKEPVKIVRVYKQGNHYYLKVRGKRIWLSPELAKILLQSSE